MSQCHFDADVAPWVLGALDDANAAQFQVHLRGCPACSAAVEELRRVTDQLPMAVPQVAPSPDLKARLMADVEADPRAVRAPVRQRRPRRSWRIAMAPAAALATVLLALGVVGGALVLDDDGPVTRSVAMQAPDGVDARLVVDGDGRGTIVLDDMPQAPAGRVYQVWLKRAAADPRPTHTLFTVREDGRARVQIDEPVADGEAVLVTAEPDGGSEVPSAAPVLAASAT